MPYFTIEIAQAQDDVLKEVLDKNPDWKRSQVLQAAVAHFLQLDPAEQKKIVG